VNQKGQKSRAIADSRPAPSVDLPLKLTFLHPSLERHRRLSLGLSVLLGGKHQKVANTSRVTPLVVVPRDQLDEGVVQHDASSGIEDGAGRVADKVGGDHGVLGVLKDTLEFRRLRGRLDRKLDFVVGSRLRKAYNQVDDGNIQSRDTEGKTTKESGVGDNSKSASTVPNSRELSIEAGNNLSDSLGGTGA
jgi:hypothetical protein